MAAQQAESVCEEQNVHVLITKSIPQGLSACIMFNPEVSYEDNLQEMSAAIAHVKTGQVTYAIKDTVIDGQEIKANEYMGIVEKKIVVCIKDRLEATKIMVDELIDSDAEIVTLIYGNDVSEDEANEISEYITSKYNVEVEVHEGKQPVYSFIVGVE